jgi:lysylphosphatidylglycerol synthetase-like protein (DUF2156 family)
MLLATSGMLVLTRLTVDADYTTEVLPGLILVGLGMGLTYTPVFANATAGVAPRDAGVTSATLNTSQQVGASLGVALLNTIATTGAGGYLAAHPAHPAQREEIIRQSLVHGYSVAIWWAAGIMLLAGLVAALMVTCRPPRSRHGAPEKAPAAQSAA